MVNAPWAPTEFDPPPPEPEATEAAGSWKAAVSRATGAARMAVRRAERAVRIGVYQPGNLKFVNFG